MSALTLMQRLGAIKSDVSSALQVADNSLHIAHQLLHNCREKTEIAAALIDLEDFEQLIRLINEARESIKIVSN